MAKMAGKCHICISPYSSVFHNFQHIWSDFFAEVSTIRESSTNNVCIPDYSLIYSAESTPLEKSRPRYKYRKNCSKFLSRNSHKIPKFLLNLV